MTHLQLDAIVLLFFLVANALLSIDNALRSASVAKMCSACC